MVKYVPEGLHSVVSLHTDYADMRRVAMTLLILFIETVISWLGQSLKTM